MGNDAGGTSGGGAAEAVAAITAQLPHFASGYTEVDGINAINYIGELIRFFPAVAPTFSALEKVGACGLENGIFAARAYVAHDRLSAGGVIIVSHNQLQQIGRISIACLVRDVIGGGDGIFTPCARFYQYDYLDQVTGYNDRYYVMLAATMTQLCDGIAAAHAPFQPTPF